MAASPRASATAWVRPLSRSHSSARTTWGRLGGTIRTAPRLPRTVSTHPADNSDEEHRELRVEELLHRARPLYPDDEMVIDDLTDEEGEAFLAAVKS